MVMFVIVTWVNTSNNQIFLGLLEDTAELQWLEHLRDHENEFETGVVRANEGWL